MLYATLAGGSLRDMAETSEDEASATATAENVAVSGIVSAMLESATTSAAKASAAPAMPDEVSGLEADSIAAGVAETVSSLLDSATSAVAATTQEQKHRTAAVPERGSVSAVAMPIVPLLSPPGSTAEHTLSGIELSGRRGYGDGEGSPFDELRRNVGGSATTAGTSQDSQGQLEPVESSDAGRLVYDEAAAKDEEKGYTKEFKAEEDEHKEASQQERNTGKNEEDKDVGEDEEHSEETLELPEDGDDRVARSSSAVDANGRKTERYEGPKRRVERVTGCSGTAERQQGGGHADDKSEAGGESSTAPNGRAFGPATAAPGVFPPNSSHGKEETQQQWQWWDNENPWSRAPRSSASIDRKVSGTAPAQPICQEETTPPPPYQEVVGGPRASRSSTQEQVVEQQTGEIPSETATSSGQALRSGSAVSNAASNFSGDDNTRGPPPSYRAAVAGVTEILSSSSDQEEEEKQDPVRHLPPPSYGRFYDDFRSATVGSRSHGGTDSSGANSEGGEWWVLEDQDHQHAPVWSGQERERGRRRNGASPGGGRQNFDRPETSDDGREGEGLGASSRRRWQHSAGRRTRTAAAGGSSRPRTTAPLPTAKRGHKDTSRRCG